MIHNRLRNLPGMRRSLFRDRGIERRLVDSGLWCGGLELTGAVYPHGNQSVWLYEGFRQADYFDEGIQRSYPVLMVSSSRSNLMEDFLGLMNLLDEEVNVALDSRHENDTHERTFLRFSIDRCVLESTLCDFEELLLGDGMLTIGAFCFSEGRTVEVQLDDHKLLIVYGDCLETLQPFRRALLARGLVRNDNLRLILDGPHEHCTSPSFMETFDQLCALVGAELEE